MKIDEESKSLDTSCKSPELKTASGLSSESFPFLSKVILNYPLDLSMYF